MIKKLKGVFFGWWMVLAAGLIALWGHGFYTYGVSAFFKPISSEFGFSRAATSVASSIGKFEGGFEAPLTGWFTDKFGPKWVVVFGVSMISIGLIAMRFIHSLLAYYIIWGVVVGTGINTALSLPADTAITNWFIKDRGKAISIKWIFSGMSGTFVLPLVAFLISTQGWRNAATVGGIVMAVVGLPLALIFFRVHRPEYYGLLPDGAKVEEGTTAAKMTERTEKHAAGLNEAEFTLKQAFMTPAYWLLIVVNAVHALASQVINIHAIAFLTDWGINAVAAAGVMAMMLTCSLPARFMGGMIADRMSTHRLRFMVGSAYFIQTSGFIVFLINKTTPSIYIWFVLYGIGMGASITLNTLMRARYFGRKSFGKIHGTSTMFMTPFTMAAPIYAGYIYDTTQSYIPIFMMLAVLGLVASALMFSPLTKPPKAPQMVA
ncbi:MAG: MFS transporter [Dehalococcoidales bacterium]|nr:MFS transporter [Dehalococcoidales bacterium]